MSPATGEVYEPFLVDQETKTHKETGERLVAVLRDLSVAERANRQILLYSPCACGSGKDFKFCCHKPKP